MVETEIVLLNENLLKSSVSTKNVEINTHFHEKSLLLHQIVCPGITRLVEKNKFLLNFRS